MRCNAADSNTDSQFTPRFTSGIISDARLFQFVSENHFNVLNTFTIVEFKVCVCKGDVTKKRLQQ